MAERRPAARPIDPADEASEAQIAVHWGEERLLPPPAEALAGANVRDGSLRRSFDLAKFPAGFERFGELLSWRTPWAELFDGTHPPFYRWFVGGELNASVNCLDRHLPARGAQTAFWFVPETEAAAPRAITYRSLAARVNEFAALLRERAGVRAGDRVTIHLPMTPELPISMLACARLGAVHSVVFAGFSGEACGRRIADAGSRVLITMDGYDRNGHRIDHRASADVALATARREGQAVERLLVWSREPGRYDRGAPERPAEELRLDEALPEFRGAEVEPVAMPSDAPLFLMYTSGTTGRPKGVQHGTAGYLAFAAATARWALDLHPEDVYWCLADIGWITGHSYIVYGPLALGATSVLFEGAPAHPDAGRPWRIAERLGVTVLYTSPTAIRHLRRLRPEGPAGHRCVFRVLGSVGEPIEPETFRWYYEIVGGTRAAVVDTWWQTETGGILCSSLPGLDPMKPGSTGPPMPGIHPAILDDEGQKLAAGSGRAGNLVIEAPWPGRMQTIWGDPERFVRTYFERYNRDPKSTDWKDWPYLTGDAALLAGDGYLRVLGRVDDVINVAGHRLGTKEIESACLTVPAVAEAAVVPVLDEVKGHLPDVFVSLRPGAPDPATVAAEVGAAIERTIGKIARPRAVYVVSDLPKTRSGKIMRRVLSAIANGTEVGDVTTLADPTVVPAIERAVRPSSRSPGAP